MNPSPTNQMLGYPADARLLILNADDFGFCQAINAAIMGALEAGAIRTTTLMVPCPWATQAMRFLAERPGAAFGVHLTTLSDPADYRWGPLTPWDRLPSLVDAAGKFFDFDTFHQRLPGIALAELEVEYRAQIEAVLAAGLRPTHLDWHAVRFGARTDIVDLMIRLAREYGLALRVIGRDTIQKVQSLGLPCIENDFLDSYSIDPPAKPARYTQMLRALPAGLTEWAIHPGLATPELTAADPTGALSRQADYDFWTAPEAQAIIAEEGIILLNYRALQPFWQEPSTNALRAE